MAKISVNKIKCASGKFFGGIHCRKNSMHYIKLGVLYIYIILLFCIQ